jgi:hypothetical protein
VTNPGHRDILVNDDPTRRLIITVIASVGLLPGVLLASFSGFVHVMASDSCYEGDAAYVCTASGQNVIAGLPSIGSMIVAGCALALAWIWPAPTDRSGSSSPTR